MCQVLVSRPVTSQMPPTPALGRRVALLEVLSIFIKQRLAETLRWLQKSEKLSQRIPHLKAALASATSSIEHLETHLDSLQSHVEDLKQNMSCLVDEIHNMHCHEQRAKKACQQKLDYLQDHNMMAMWADLAAAETNMTEAQAWWQGLVSATHHLYHSHNEEWSSTSWGAYWCFLQRCIDHLALLYCRIHSRQAHWYVIHWWERQSLDAINQWCKWRCTWLLLSLSSVKPLYNNGII